MSTCCNRCRQVLVQCSFQTEDDGQCESRICENSNCKTCSKCYVKNGNKLCIEHARGTSGERLINEWRALKNKQLTPLNVQNWSNISDDLKQILEDDVEDNPEEYAAWMKDLIRGKW